MNYLPFIIITLLTIAITTKSGGDLRAASLAFLLHLGTRFVFLIPIAGSLLGFFPLLVFNPLYFLVSLAILSGSLYFWKKNPLMKYYCIYTIIFLVLGSQMALWIPFGYVLLSYIDVKRKQTK